MIKIKTLSKDNFASKAIKDILYSIINILAYIPMLCAFKYNQTLVHPITTRGASNISPVSHPQLAMPLWAGPRGSLALLARSQDLHLTSPSRSCLNPGPCVCISPPSWLLSTSIQAHKVASQLHPSTISNQSNFQDVHLTSFQVCKIASEVHPVNISNSYRFKMYVSTPCRSCLTSIQIPGYLYHLLPCTIWPQSRSLDPHPTSTSWCRYSCLTSSQAVSHLHPSLKICGSLPYRFPINLIQVWRCNVPLPLCPYFHPGPLDSHFTSIQAVSHPIAGPDICLSPQPMWRLS